MVVSPEIMESRKNLYQSSGQKMNLKSSSFANDESRKASFGRRDGDGRDVIKYLEDHPETQEIWCEDSFESKYLGPLHKVLVQNHSFTHLYSMELPNNGLTAETCQDIAKILQSQQHTLSKLNLSHNPLTAVGIASLTEPLILDSPPSKLRILNLTDTQMGSKGATAMASLLRYNSSVQELYIGTNQIGAKGIRAISPELRKNTTLKVLNVSSNAIKSQGAALLADALMNATGSGLRTIDISCNKVGPAGIQAFAKLLAVDRRLEGLYASRNDIGPEGARLLHNALKVNYTLKDLRLEANNIGDIGFVKIVESLAETFLRTSGVEKLVLGYNKISSEGAKSLCRVLKENEKLRHIDLTGNMISSTAAQAIAGSLSYNLGLQELLLTSNQIDDEGAYALSLSMAKTSCTMTRLSCDDNPMSNEGLAALSRVPQLRRNQKYWLGPLLRDLSKDAAATIDLTERNVGDDEILLLTEVLDSSSPVIRAMYLSGVLLSRRSLVPFCERSLGPKSNIMRLYLNKCDCGDELATSISSILKINKSLQVLSLTESSVSAVGACAIAEGLSGNKTLRRLNLDRNNIGDEGMSALGQIIGMTSLQSLSASRNSLTDLSMDFEFVKHLQELHLSGNQITDFGALVLCRYLVAESKLLWLSMRETQVTIRGREAIKTFLPDNATFES
jgi:Ran GTPase-activating protein (RanGAP) involved in mRNA processing and transport